MKLFKPAKVSMAFAKVGLLGFAGSGKTRTAWEIAQGLHASLKSKKPVAMLDTETGSDFIKPLADQAKIPLVVSRSRAFELLMEATKEAEEISDIVIIDSVSHYWLDLIESYRKKNHIKGNLTFQAWATLKPMWQEFSTWFVSSSIHVIVCGRAGNIWDYFRNEDSGKMELYKTGTKMKAEGEFGYEPSLLVEMEQLQNPEAIQDYHQAKGKEAKEAAAKKMRHSRQWIRRAWVLKDRADILDGKFFDDPTYKDFAPHWQFLNVGGKHEPIEPGDSQDLFDREGKPEWKKEKEQAAITLEEITNEMIKTGLSGTAEQVKKDKIRMLEFLFESGSWQAISAMPLSNLKQGLAVLRSVSGSSDLKEGILKRTVGRDKYFPPEKDVPF